MPDFTQLCGAHPNWITGLGLAFVLAWECYIGKTEKIKAGSTVELVFIIAVAVCTALFKRRKDGISR